MAGGTPAGQPLAAIIDPRYADRLVIPRGMGIGLHAEGPEKDGMIPGAWYEGANPGTWVSIILPDVIAPSILQSYGTIVNTLDRVEAASLCYLIAFDLDHFELGYELGTDHPRVNWSDRVAEPMRNPDCRGPMASTASRRSLQSGRIRPDIVPKTVATFIGGFKRTHGAFKFGDLARRNHGSHYGFIENGVVFSKLQPGLATVFVLDDGSVGMKTWTETDNALLARIRHARQNGVPLVEARDAARDGAESDEGSRAPVPGSLVNNWGAGNWSGSEDEKLRTMRAGLALQTSHGKRFLIYAVFSDATPSAMARVFQSYRTNYAMLLDMNALEHTYLAVYRTVWRRAGRRSPADRDERAGSGALRRARPALSRLFRQPGLLLCGAQRRASGQTMRRLVIAGSWMLVLPVLFATGAPPTVAQQVREQNEALFRQLQQVRGLTDSQLDCGSTDLRTVRLHQPGESSGHAPPRDAGAVPGEARSAGRSL